MCDISTQTEQQTEKARWLTKEQKHEQRLNNDWQAGGSVCWLYLFFILVVEGVGGHKTRDKTHSDRAAFAKTAQASTCWCVLWHAYTSFLPPTTPRQLAHTWPHPALTGPTEPVAKEDEKGDCFLPHGGQSLWIHQPSLKPSPLGSGAQQAPFSPQEDGGLWNNPPAPDSRDMLFVWQRWGVHWWLTPSLWTYHARNVKLQSNNLNNKAAMLCQSKVFNIIKGDAECSHLCFLLLFGFNEACFAQHIHDRSLYHHFVVSVKVHSQIQNHAQLHFCLLFVDRSSQESPELLGWTEPSIACYSGPQSFPLCEQSNAIMQQRSREKPGVTGQRQSILFFL